MKSNKPQSQPTTARKTPRNQFDEDYYDPTKDVTLPETHGSFSLDFEDIEGMAHSTPYQPRILEAPPSPKQFQEPLPVQMLDESGLEEEYDMLVREVEGVSQLKETLKQFDMSLAGMESQLKSFHQNIKGTEKILNNWGNLIGNSILADSLIRTESWKGGAQDAAVEDLVGEFDLPDSLSFGQM